MAEYLLEPPGTLAEQLARIQDDYDNRQITNAGKRPVEDWELLDWLTGDCTGETEHGTVTGDY